MVTSSVYLGNEGSAGSMFYIHKHEVGLNYGGPEEGGWWFEIGSPVKDWNVHAHRFYNEDKAYEKCRELNYAERERAKNEEDYEYSSVLSYRSEHFAYRVEPTPVMKPYPEERPHYE